MAEKTTPRGKETARRPGWFDLHPEVRRAVWGVFFVGAAAFTTLSLVGRGGRAGALLRSITTYLFGEGAWVLPLLFLTAGVLLVVSRHGERLPLRVVVSGLTLFLSAVALLGLASGEALWGGMAGRLLVVPTEYLVGYWAGYLVWAILLTIAGLLLFNVSPLALFGGSRQRAGEAGSAAAAPEGAEPRPGFGEKMVRVLTPRFLLAKLGNERRGAASPGEPAASSTQRALLAPSGETSYRAPPLELLEAGSSQPTPGDVEVSSGLIRKTFENFGISVEMAEVNVGPTVTQYTLKPAEGVKLSRIVALQNDLALALAAHPLRLEAPIPGRSLVGIEIPNKAVALVRLRALFEEVKPEAWRESLAFVVGRDVTGNPFTDTLTRMPHLLIAGATGSGKSIAIHNLLVNLVYRHGPEELQFLLVDPKRVELAPYTGIPHLLAPVIVEPAKTISALRWAIGEMERRYALFAEAGARDVVSYRSERRALPYVVIVIDELADIMAAFGRELEAAVVRLAQMARAVGIHLVVSTQRPSVEVITGLIKANITARIAFQVASQIDSRTILDVAGAEKLIGRGDMLFLKGDGSKPRRLQGAYVSEKDVTRVTGWLKKTYAEKGPTEAVVPETTLTPTFTANVPPRVGAEAPWINVEPTPWLPSHSSGDEPGEEPLYQEARRVVIEAKRGSASLLQRRLRVGYARAARLIDLLEERGVIGPGNGAKARDVRVPPHTGDEYFS